jgi:YD repeat-containing protein
MHQTRINTRCKRANHLVTAALGKTWSLAYNSAGDLSQITDPLLNETRLSTDALGRTTQATNPLGYTTEQTYNSLDQPLETKDALAQTTKNIFDTGNSRHMRLRW